MVRRVLVVILCGLLLGTLGLSLTWGQTPAQLVNGNRTHAGATNYGVTTGTGTAYILTLNKPIPGYAEGSCYLLEIHASNTGPATLNVNGRGAKSILKYVSGASTALGAGDFGAGQVVEVCYDGVNMQAQLGGGGGPGGPGDIGTVGSCNSADCFTAASPSASLTFNNATSGTVRLEAVPGALSSNVARLKAETGSLCTDASVCTGYQPFFNLLTNHAQLKRDANDFAAFPQKAVPVAADRLLLEDSASAPQWQKKWVDIASLPSGGPGSGIGAVGTCASGDCFTSGTPSSALFFQAAAAPGNPPSGSGVVYYDTASLNLAVRTAAGVINHGIQTSAPVANQFLTGINDNGSLQRAQPDFAGLTGTGSVVTLTGTQRLSNKQVDHREVTLADVASVPVNVDLGDIFIRDSMSVNPTFQTPTGTGGNPVCSQDITFRLTTASERPAAWSAAYVAVGIPLPTVLRASPFKNHIKFRYNCATTSWELISINLKTGSETAYVNLPISGIKMHPTLPTGPSVAAATTIVWFDEFSQECVLWDWTIPGDYLGTPVLRLFYTMLSDINTAHSATFNVQVWAMKAGQSVLTANFDPTINNCDDSNIPGTVGVWNDIGCALTANDAMAANDPVQFQICSDVTGTWTGDLGLVRARFEYAR